MLQKFLFVAVFAVFIKPCSGQDTLSLKLDDFKDPSKAWKEVGAIQIGYSNPEIKTSKGEGIILNEPTKKNPGEDMYSKRDFGDFDLQLEYMMAPHSNSGVYMHGRYEVQLLDSWGKEHVKYNDNGGLYERWTDQETGYEGEAPRQNVSKAPGLWQKLYISFTAPRFDPKGQKTANARISVWLNGIMIHDDAELTGPTRGSNGEEAATGPLRIQGDHGIVAFRNIKIIPYENPLPEISGLKYNVYEGDFRGVPDFSKIKPVASGTSDKVTAQVTSLKSSFLLTYSGTLDIRTAGKYTFKTGFNGGGGGLLINKKPVIGPSDWNGEGTIELPQGQATFDLFYSKVNDWAGNGLSFSVSGPGIRPIELSESTATMANIVDPIYLDAPNILRSFMDLPNGDRVTRAVSVGSAKQVHYTYDMGHGALVQAWRGEFLDTTPMWHDRGDGSSRPRGTVSYIDRDVPLIEKLTDTKADWKKDTTGMNFRIKGYDIDENNTPIFHYIINGVMINDHSVVDEEGHGLTRTITTENGGEDLFARVATGKATEISPGLYRIEGNYFIDLGTEAKPVIRQNSSGQSEMLLPVNTSLTYSILF